MSGPHRCYLNVNFDNNGSQLRERYSSSRVNQMLGGCESEQMDCSRYLQEKSKILSNFFNPRELQNNANNKLYKIIYSLHAQNQFRKLVAKKQ